MKSPYPADFDAALRLTVSKMTATELLDLINEMAAKDIAAGNPIEGAHFRALNRVNDALKREG